MIVGRKCGKQQTSSVEICKPNADTIEQSNDKKPCERSSSKTSSSRRLRQFLLHLFFHQILLP
jgi:hypothetical protein